MIRLSMTKKEISDYLKFQIWFYYKEWYSSENNRCSSVLQTHHSLVLTENGPTTKHQLHFLAKNTPWSQHYNLNNNT